MQKVFFFLLLLLNYIFKSRQYIINKNNKDQRKREIIFILYNLINAVIFITSTMLLLYINTYKSKCYKKIYSSNKLGDDKYKEVKEDK
jgi:hypothetical protein